MKKQGEVITNQEVKESTVEVPDITDTKVTNKNSNN